MPATFDPHSFRYQVWRLVEVKDEHGAYRKTYPEMIWEEPPGRELAMAHEMRFSMALSRMDLAAIEIRGRVSLARVWLYGVEPRVEQIYSNTPFSPRPIVPKSHVWVKPSQAVAR